MRRLRRLGIGACIAGGLAALATAGTAAADGIDRPPGAIDGRGWELVSQADKNNNHVVEGIVAAYGHDRVLYSLHGGAPGANGGNQPQYLATRTASGWVSSTVMPPRDEMYAPHYLPFASTPDLGSILTAVYIGIAGQQYATDQRLVLLDGAGGQTLLHTFPTYQGSTGIPAMMSDDAQRIYANVDEQIDGSHQAGTTNVYDFGVSPPLLVGTMPGTDDAPACGVPDAGPGFPAWDVAQHQISPDGRRIFFATDGDVCDGVLNLYLHDRDAGETTLLSGPPVGGADDNGVTAFVGATPDGSLVTYTTKTSLAPGDGIDGDDDLDVYQYDLDTRANACLTCGQVSVRDTRDGIPVVGAAEDGATVYFVSPDAALPGAVGGADNVYVLSRDILAFVGITTHGVTSLLDLGPSEVSRDGRFLVFASDRAEMDAISGADNGGRVQYYRYDRDRADVVCVSCPPGGAATADVVLQRVTGVQDVRAELRGMSDDGSMVFFTTPDKLVVADVNDDDDLYEWHDGVVGLISDGLTRHPSGFIPQLLTVSPDGLDVFFVDHTALTWDAQDEAMKVYSARAGGGFPAPPPPPPPCAGDACRAAPTPPPGLRHPSSVEARGQGNVRPAKPVLVTSKVKRLQRKRFARRGRLVLRVRVGRPGRVAVVGQARVGKRIRRVARGAARVGRSGRARIVVRLSRPARRWLARRGRLRVVLGVSYSQSPRGKRIVVPLRSTHKRGR